MKAIGITVPTPKGEATVLRLLMTEFSGYKAPSTFYEAKLANGDVVPVHSNIVEGVASGEITEDPYARKPRGPRKVSTKKERALKWVNELKRKHMSRGEIIKVLRQKLRVSKGTAQTYYYAVR